MNAFQFFSTRLLSIIAFSFLSLALNAQDELDFDGRATAGEQSSTAGYFLEFSPTGGSPDAIETIGDTGTNFANAGPITLTLPGDGPPVAEASGQVQGRGMVVRDEGDMLRFIASCDGAILPKKTSSPVAGEAKLLLAGATTSLTFEVTGGSMPCQIIFKFVTGATGEVTLKEVGGVQLYDSSSPDADQSFSDSLDAGTYEVTFAWSQSDSGTTQLLKEGLVGQMVLGYFSKDPVRPTLGEFVHPEVVTARTGGDLLAIESPEILSEVSLGDGLTELEVTTLVENLGGAPWPEVEVVIAEQMESQPTIEVISQLPIFEIAGDEIAGPPIGIRATLRVADADLENLKTTILDGSRFQISGVQQAVFSIPPVPLGEDNMRVDPEGKTPPGIKFPTLDYVPLVASGSLFLEWESLFKVPLAVVISDDFPPKISYVQGIDTYLPALISDVVLQNDMFVVTLFETNEIGLSGSTRTVTLADVMIHGTVDSTMTYEGHPDDLAVTEIPESRYAIERLGLVGFYPGPLPFHFNEIQLSSGVNVSGSFGFEPESIDVLLEMEDLEIKELSVSAKYRADCNLLLESEECADNSRETIAGREGTLLDVEILSLQLPMGFSFKPRLQLQAGALITAPTSLSLPLTAGLDIEMTAGVRDGLPFYEGDFTEIPLQVSDPGLYEAATANATAYLDCEIKGFLGAGVGSAQVGPTLGVRAQADFELAPLDDPWWKIEAGISTFAGVEFNIAGLITLIDEEKTLETWPLFEFDAGGPLISLRSGKSFDPQPGLQAIGDARTRWTRSIRPDEVGADLAAKSFALKAEGSDDIITGSNNVLARLSPEGELLWALDPTVQLPPSDAVAEPDGGFTALSRIRNSIRLARFSADGDLIWKSSLAPTDGTLWFRTTDLIRRDGPGGAVEYFVLGEANGGSPNTFHLALVKLDANGDLIWSKRYAVQPFTSEATSSIPKDLALTADGNLLVAGSTNANVSEGGLDLFNLSTNGIVLKIDADNGEVLWNTVTALRYAVDYDSVLEAPDGSIYAGGNSGGNVRSDMPTMLLTRLDANGILDESILIGSGPGNEAAPRGGETLFDTIRDMTWVDDHLWVCGNIGIYNGGGVGSVGHGESAFTAMIDEKFHVSRFAIHAGPATERFSTIEATSDGLLVSGMSNSFHPWPQGAGGEGEGTPSGLMTAMLPWEGRTRFHLASSAATGGPEGESDRGNFFITPRTRAASLYTINTNQSHFAGLGQVDLTEEIGVSLTIIPTDIEMVRGDFLLDPAPIEPLEFKALEFMPRSLIKDEESFLQWYQIDSDANDDGDDYPASVEFYFGSDPLKPNFGLIDFEFLAAEEEGEFDRVQYSFPRSLLAGKTLPGVFSSIALSGFDPRTDVTVKKTDLDAARELIQLILPANEDQNFYRLGFGK